MAQGFSDVPVKQPYGMQVEMSAADYIVKKCRQYSGEVILCPVGPLTNIAAALKADPELVNHVQKVVIMGGGLVPGNVSAYAKLIFGMILMQQITYLRLIGTLILLADVTRKFHVMMLILPSSGNLLQTLAGSCMRFLRFISNIIIPSSRSMSVLCMTPLH